LLLAPSMFELQHDDFQKLINFCQLKILNQQMIHKKYILTLQIIKKILFIILTVQYE
jgi:hypothetical protein